MTARIRSIKPEFGTNETLGKLRPIERLFFALLPCHADRKGLLKDRPVELGYKIIPYDMPDADPSVILDTLHSARLVCRYQAGQDRLLQIMGFVEHQRPNKREQASELPEPDDSRVCTCMHVQDDGEGKGREGNGRERKVDAPGRQKAAPGAEASKGSKSTRKPTPDPLNADQAELVEKGKAALLGCSSVQIRDPDTLFARLVTAYPNVGLAQAVTDMDTWAVAKKVTRSATRGWPLALKNWMSKDQDRYRPNGGAAPQSKKYSGLAQ